MQRDPVCRHCGKRFKPNPRIKGQQYCSAEACQRHRKRVWHRNKMQTDISYRQNQADAQKRWRSSHPDYWRTYRMRHPSYTARNREGQRVRNRRHRVHFSSKGPLIAKMDASDCQPLVSSGTYELVPTRGGRIAKMDALIVQLSVLSSVTESWVNCKDRTR